MSHVYKKGINGKTFILFHGTGGTEEDLIPLARTIDSDANILSFRGRINESGMLRFFKRISPGVFDLDSLVEETHYYIKTIQELSIKYAFNLNDVILLGYSNGANMIGSLLLHQQNFISKSILIRPMVPLKHPPYHDLDGLKVLILSGKFDSIVPLQEISDLRQLFQERHVEVTLHLLDAGHSIISSEIQLIEQWYKN